MDSYRDSGLLKLVSKPDPVLLEDPSSEASGERHDKTAAILSFWQDNKGRTIRKVMGGVGNFQLVRMFFSLTLVQEFFSQVKPSCTNIFFETNVALFRTVKSWIYVSVACEQAHVGAQARSEAARSKSSGLLPMPPDRFAIHRSRVTLG